MKWVFGFFSDLAAANRSLYGTDSVLSRTLDGANNARFRNLYRARFYIIPAPNPADGEDGSGQDIVSTGVFALAAEREHEGAAPVEIQQTAVPCPDLVATATRVHNEAAVLAQLAVTRKNIGATIYVGRFAGFDGIVELFAITPRAIAAAERATASAVPIIAENSGAEAF
jgi:hypothetical protein